MVRHYLDHASTSPLRPEAADAMAAWAATGVVADPGRLHAEGHQARAALEGARDEVAALVGVRSRQVVFTSGATEAANTAVWGTLQRSGAGPVAFADVEHSAVREATVRLAPQVRVAVDGTGRITPEAVDDALDRSLADHGVLPALVHCQWANHEVGTVQPVADVIDRCRRRGVPVHVDAAMALGRAPVDLTDLGAALVSLSSHKAGGPPGIGALVLGAGTRITPLLVGGEAERGRRGGMENVPAAVGFGAVARALDQPGRIESERSTLGRIDAAVVEGAQHVRGVRLIGHPTERIPGIVCLAVHGVEAEPVLLGLDRAGVAVHSGSACSSESLEPSPVLEAMGIDGQRSLRVSAGWSSTEDDATAFATAFARVVADLRALRG